MFEKLFPVKYMLMYAADVTIPKDDPRSRSEMPEFRTFLGMAWFIMRNEAALAALRADRVQLIQITPEAKKNAA